MKLLQILPDAYGPATKRMHEVQTLAAQIQFFPRVTAVPPSVVRAAREHLGRYARLAEPGHLAEPAIVLGSAEVLRELRVRIEQEPGGEQFADRWSAKLGRLLQRMTDEAMQNPTLRGRIGPPLWPMPGLPNVVQFLVADDEPAVLARAPTPERDLWWELACGVDCNVWNALLWELIVEPDAGDTGNPFLPIVELHAAGFYPLGFLGRAFVIFALTAGDEEDRVVAGGGGG
jgi:hypothetical protein